MGKGLAQCKHLTGTQHQQVPSIAGPQMSQDPNEGTRWVLRSRNLKTRRRWLDFVGFAFGFRGSPTSVFQEDTTSALHIVSRERQAAGLLEREPSQT